MTIQSEIRIAASQIGPAFQAYKAAIETMAALCDTLSCAFEYGTPEFEAMAEDCQRFEQMARGNRLYDYDGIAAKAVATTGPTTPAAPTSNVISLAEWRADNKVPDWNEIERLAARIAGDGE